MCGFSLRVRCPLISLVAAFLALASCAPSDLLAILDGPEGAALSITPTAMSAPPLGTVSFTAGGGVPPYVFSMVSGVGTFDPDNAVYTAPYAVGTAVIRVTDKAGATRDATVTVQPFAALDISPKVVTVSVQGTVTFSPVGGAPPYTFSMRTAGSGGASIGAATGVYVPGPTPATDVVQLSDAAGTVVTATVTVSPLSVIDYAVSWTSLAPLPAKASSLVSGNPTFTIQNIGTIAGTAPIAWKAYLSATPSGEDHLLATGTYGTSLLPMATSPAMTLPGTTAYPAVTPGTYYLVVKVSSAEDTSPGNNSSSRAVTMSARSIDYSPTTIAVSGSVTAGGSFTLDFGIKNTGTDDGIQPVAWTAYLSAGNATLDGSDAVVGTGSHTWLPAGATTPVSVTGTWPAPGTWFLIVQVSAPDSNPSSNEAASPQVDVYTPDYAVSLAPATVPWSGVAGGAMDDYPLVTVQNITAGVGQKDIQWQVYLSTDPGYGAGDILVEGGAIPGGLAASPASTSFPLSSGWPLGIAGGAYYLIVRVDAVDETNATNNVATSTHVIALGNYRYPEGPEDNSAAGPPATLPTSDTRIAVASLGRGETLAIEGTKDGSGQCDTYRFDVSTTTVLIRAFWATGADDVDLRVWDTGVVDILSSSAAADAEPAVAPSIALPTGFVSAQFKTPDIGKYVILVTGQ